MGGEAEARSHLDLPGEQQQIIDTVAASGKPFVVVLFNSRPLVLKKVDAAAPAILEAWFGGVEAGNGVADVLFGKVNPGGKLPVTFPRNVGQVPIYYNHENTGRPGDPNNKYTSKYLDLPLGPQLPFGFGLSYTTFEVGAPRLSSQRISTDGSVNVSVDVRNTGSRVGDEVVQLYVRDVVSSVTRPVKELKGFRRVTLKPGEATTVEFTLGKDAFAFYNEEMKYVLEPGEFQIMAGPNSAELKTTALTIAQGSGRE
jgi:beta-glucosidase